MSSSINSPEGVATKRYEFDLDFDQEEERIRLEFLRQEELLRQAEANPSAQPKYTENDLESAKSDAFQRGQQHGQEESKKVIETVLVSLVERTLSAVQVLLANEMHRDEIVTQTALRVAMGSIKKFLPRIIQLHGIEIVEKTLRETLANNPDEMRIVLRVHDSILDLVVKRLPQIKEQEAFAGKIIVIADETVQEGDCKLEWADGGLERMSSGLAQRLDKAMEYLSATLQQTNQETDQAERVSS
jgi:flagellar assembly protein FliH